MVMGPDGKEVKKWIFLAPFCSAPMSLSRIFSDGCEKFFLLMCKVFCARSFNVQGDKCCQFDCTEDSLWTLRNLGVDGWNASEII